LTKFLKLKNFSRMDLVVTKVIVLLLLAGIKLGSGLSPILLVKLLKKENLTWLEKFMSGSHLGSIIVKLKFIFHLEYFFRSFVLWRWCPSGYCIHSHVA
jgi:hypothetical protein